jgi:heterodisulfide reductase subunit C
MSKPRAESLADSAADFAARVEDLSDAKINACLQCAKCTSGCPVAARADIKPHELLRLVQLGMADEALSSRAIWQCVSCQTCATRCPQGVNIAAMTDVLRRLSRAVGKAAPQTNVPLFNDIFLNSVRKRGRMHEMGLMAAYKLRTMDLFTDMAKLPMMLRKGKLRLFGKRAGDKAARKRMFDQAGAAGGQGK